MERSVFDCRGQPASGESVMAFLSTANRVQALTDSTFREEAARLRQEPGFLGTGTDARLLANALRWRNFYRPTSLYGHRLGAGVSIVSSYRGMLDLFTTDSWGLCKNKVGGEDAEMRVRQARRDGKAVIAVFGGSTVQGIGASLPEFTIPALVEAVLLEEYGLETVCLNHGVAGWTCAEELLYLLHETTYCPDVCVFYDGWNCCWHLYHAVQCAVRAALSPLRQAHASWERGTSLLQCERNQSTELEFSVAFLARRLVVLLANSLLSWGGRFSPPGIRGVAEKVVELLFPVRPASHSLATAKGSLSEAEQDQFVREAVTEYVRIHFCARTLCEARGIHFFHFYQPLLLNTGKELTVSEKTLKTREHAERFQEVYRRFRWHLQLLSAPGATTDLSGALDGVREEVFLDGGHLNHCGNYYVARCIARHLVEGNCRPLP